MIQLWLGVLIITEACVIAALWIKAGFIWRDTMLEQNEQRRKDLDRLNYLKSKRLHRLSDQD